jgi:hypothetical protein
VPVAVEIAAVGGQAWSEGIPIRLDVEVTTTVRGPGGETLDTVVVRGRGEEVAGTTAAGLSGATARAVKQAAELFRGELAARPALAGRLGLPPREAAAPSARSAAGTAVEAPVARPPPFDPPRGALAFQLGTGLGWNGEVQGSDLATLHVSGALGWSGRRLRLGLEGGFEGAVNGGYDTGWLGLAGGWSFPSGEDRRLELAAGLGQRFFTPVGSETLLGTRRVSGGSAGLPYAAARVIFWIGPRQLAWGLVFWAESTLGSVRTTYRAERCFLDCIREEVPVRYGGIAAGLSGVLGAQTVLQPSPASAGSEVGGASY